MMSEQAMNVAIAEACGWERRGPDYWVHGRFDSCDEPPNYTGDLNAMHEAVMYADSRATAWNAPDGRNDTFQEAYIYNLTTVCKCGYWSIVHATSIQRAEAFLRTLGKWVEE